jgi:two-component system chemotaxis response regulator CheY
VTVLVVDDDAGTRLLVRRVLRGRFDCEVLEAADGSVALEILSKREVALVMLDLQMPQVSGLDVLRVLRGSSHAAELPVIILTSEKHAEVVREVVALGIADYMTKPLNVELVTARLLKLFPDLDAGAGALAS